MAPILSYLHVKFTSVEDAQRALKLHRQPIGNKRTHIQHMVINYVLFRITRMRRKLNDRKVKDVIAD
jgi:hypothetical protein